MNKHPKGFILTNGQEVKLRWLATTYFSSACDIYSRFKFYFINLFISLFFYWICLLLSAAYISDKVPFSMLPFVQFQIVHIVDLKSNFRGNLPDYLTAILLYIGANKSKDLRLSWRGKKMPLERSQLLWSIFSGMTQNQPWSYLIVLIWCLCIV